MKHLKLIGALLSAAYMVSMLGANAAQARDPQWMVAGALLGNGVSKTITAEAENNQVLKFSGLTFECKKLTLLKATITGSTAPKPGTSLEVILYEECSAVGFPKCEFNGVHAGKIETLLLKDFLAYETKAAALEANGKGTVSVFEPAELAKGVENKLFATFKLSELNPGSGECPLTGEVKVTRAAKVAGVVAINVEPTTEAKVHLLKATANKTYWLNEGTDVEKKAGLLVIGLAATYEGTVKVKLNPEENFSVL